MSGRGRLGRGRQGAEHLGPVCAGGGAHQGRLGRGRGLRLLSQVQGGRGAAGRHGAHQLQVLHLLGPRPAPRTGGEEPGATVEYLKKNLHKSF